MQHPHPEDPGQGGDGGDVCEGEAVAREDYERDIIDEDLTDSRLYRHRAELYRRGLQPYFKELGGGVWLSRKAELPLFELGFAWVLPSVQV